MLNSPRIGGHSFTHRLRVHQNAIETRISHEAPGQPETLFFGLSPVPTAHHHAVFSFN